MSYRDIITIEPDKRGGRPCIRRMRITVYDVLGWLAVGMSTAEIIDDFPELTKADVMACLEFAADREHRLVASVSAAWNCFSTRISAGSWLIDWLMSFLIRAMFNSMTWLRKQTPRFGSLLSSMTSASWRKMQIFLREPDFTVLHPKWFGCDVAMHQPVKSSH